MDQRLLNEQGEVMFALVFGALCMVALLVQWIGGRRAEARRRRRLRETANLVRVQAEERRRQLLMALRDE